MAPRQAAGLAAILSTLAFAPGATAAVTFQPAQPYAASSPWWSAVADLNNDGRLDVATASNTTNIVSALLGNGDGTLQGPLNTLPAASFLNAIAAGDLNGDGRADVAVAVNGSPGSMRVYLSNGDGTFAPGTSYAAGDFPQDVVIAPMDGNSSPDIAVANQTSNDVSVYLNDGAGTFAPAPGSPVSDPGGNDFLGIGAADLDGDGFTDLAAGGLNGTSPGVFFFKGSATGAFAAPVPLGGAGAQKPVAGDLTGDGRTDIVASRPASGDIVIIRGNATGFDGPVAVNPDGPGGNNGRIALGDLDGDGDLDLAVPNSAGSQADKVSIVLGGGSLTATSHEPVGAAPRQVAAGDLNGDGNLDLVTSSSGAGNVSVLLAIPPGVTVTPAIAFGDRPQGTQSAEQTITVRNDGPPRLRPSAVTLAGADASQFSISSNTCAGANLAVGATCAVGVRFGPNGLGARSAQVAISSNGAGTPHVVSLTGTGVTALLPGACANRRQGTARRDRLAGTAAGDRLLGLGGNDILDGLGGADCLVGGRGRDRLFGRRGNDRLSGGVGNDRLSGGTGNDSLVGGRGRNTYSGGRGRDKIRAANRVAERVDCGPGRDTARVDRTDRVRGCERVTRLR